MRRCALVLATALISVTALAGCGSADDAASEAPDDSSSSSTEGSEEPSPDDGDKGDKKDTDDKSDKSDKLDKGEKKNANDKRDKNKKKGSDGKSDGPAKNVNAEYCAEVKGMMSTFDPSNSASLANATDMDAIVNQFGTIADVAPGKVRSDWSALTSAYGTLAAKLNKFHVDLTDPKGLSKLNRKQQKVIQKAIAKTQKVAPSVQAIEANIKSTCGVSMR